jgi:protein-tyrosine-phosphatase
MREVGIDISTQRPKMLAPEMVEHADMFIVMGCEVESVCPAAAVPTEDGNWRTQREGLSRR